MDNELFVIAICVLSCTGMIAAMLIVPKIKLRNVTVSTYWLAPVIGALSAVAFGLIDIHEIADGLTSHAAINPLKILILFLSMTVISIFLDETGFFRYLANEVLKRTGNSQLRLFTAFYVTISIVTIFTSNDVVILTFTPFICYFAKNAKVDPIPYLVSGFVAANTCSMLLIIGNPTNIYLGTMAGIDFMSYVKVMALPTLLAGITAYIVMLAIFRKRLKLPMTGSPENFSVQRRPLLLSVLVLLLAGTALLAVSSYIRVEMWFIAFAAVVALIAIVIIFTITDRRAPAELGRTVKRVPWELVPFVISMFIIVLALGKYGVTMQLASLFGNDNTVFVYGSASVLFSNLVNNIPMSVLFSNVLTYVPSDIVSGGVYASIIGSNIGAFVTPVGALAGIMWLSILRTYNIEFGFARFIKYGLIIALPVLLASLIGLHLIIA